MSLHHVDIEDAIVVHKKIILRAGTQAGVRDFALLHSAVERPKATFAGQDICPTLWAKAAALLQSLCMNHPFTDGNKRISWTITHKFLWMNGFVLNSTRFEAAGFMIHVNNDKPDLPEIAAWLKSHCVQRKA